MTTSSPASTLASRSQRWVSVMLAARRGRHWPEANGRRMRRTKDRKPLDLQAAEVGRLAEAAADAAGSCKDGRRVAIGSPADS